MSERLLPKEIIVATAHDLDLLSQDGQVHSLRAPRIGIAPDRMALDELAIVRATERRVPRWPLTIELEDGEQKSVPIFEVSYTGLENQSAMQRLMAGLALNQIVVASRIGGRQLLAKVPDAQDRFGHPARIVRDAEDAHILAAEYIGLPQPGPYRGARQLERMDEVRPRQGVWRLVNYLPEDMYLVTPDGELHVANCGLTADVNYDYDPVGQTAEGVVIARSTPKEIVDLPQNSHAQELRLVHSELLFEALRLGIASPEEASRMVIACGVRRSSSNHQGNAFTSLAFFSSETLRDIYERIKI